MDMLTAYLVGAAVMGVWLWAMGGALAALWPETGSASGGRGTGLAPRTPRSTRRHRSTGEYVRAGGAAVRPDAARTDEGSGESATPRPGCGAGSPVLAFCNEGAARTFEAAVLSNLEASAGGGGWYPVAPFGDHPHPYGLQCLTADDAAGLVLWAANQGPQWTGVPVHADPAHPKDGPALAWVKRFRAMDNELQCCPEWSPKGQELILVNMAYKRATPSWLCQQGSDGKWHPKALLHIGLTNVPNIKATRPWVNAEGQAGGQADGGAVPEPPPRDQAGPSDSPEQQAAADAGDAPAGAGGAPASPQPAVAEPGTAGGPGKGTQGTDGTDATTMGNGGAPAPAAGPPPSGVPAVGHAVEGSGEPAAPRPAEPSGLLARVAALESELSAVRSELAAERAFGNAAAVDLYIARGRVDPGKRAAALEICAAGRAVALRAWDNGPAVAAVPRRNGLAGFAVANRPPADPLAGVVLANSAAANAAGGGSRPGPEDLARIVAASKRLQAERGMDPGAANDEAWAMHRNGTLMAFMQRAMTKEMPT